MLDVAVFDESAAADRTRGHRWRGVDIPEWDRAEVERQDLMMCVARGGLRDPMLGRAMLRRTNLLEPPNAIFDDPLVVERARNVQAILADRAARPPKVTRASLLDLLAAPGRRHRTAWPNNGCPPVANIGDLPDARR